LLEHQWLKNAKKKAFLAEALLGTCHLTASVASEEADLTADIPPIEARQELREF